MTRIIAMLLGCLALIQSSAVGAEDIAIDDPRWHLLSDAEKSDLERTLKEAGAIGPDDRLVYTGTQSSGVSQQNNPSLIAKTGAELAKKAGEAKEALTRQAAYVYNSLRLKSCKLKSTSEQKQACRDEEAKRYQAAKAALR